MIISKSGYMLFLRHPAWLWLKKFEKDKLPPIDANLQTMFDAGHEFETYIEKLYPNAVRLGFSNYSEYQTLPYKTQQALDQGAKTILQGRFEADGLTCIIDVLERIDGGVFDLIEIKSSTKAKPEHEYDLAFQTIVLEKAEIKIRNISVIHANKEYVRDGDIEPEKLSAKIDITQQVRALIDLTKKQIDQAFLILSQKDRPDMSPGYVNQIDVANTQWFNDWLDIYKSFNPGLDPYSIYNLAYPNAQQIGTLEDRGISLIKDVPKELTLREKQVVQIQTTRDNKRIIDKQKIKEFIDTFEYPLYFLDYETFSSVIPQFDGCSPYADYPFQYSLHVLRSPDSELEHFEYLHNDSTNPMPGLLEQLKKDIGDTGTVLAWNMSYEKSCNDRMAKFYPEYAEFLTNLNERINDLMIPFSKMWFFDKDFFGSASVKKVMPVLAPELSYKEINIGDGLLARRMWTQTVLEGKNQANRGIIIKDLSRYCTLDTFAMVRILEELKKLIF